MDNRKIEQLLAAFYNGSATAEEEQQLSQYFLSEKPLPACREADRKLFHALHASQHAPLPEGLAHRLEQQIDRWATSGVSRRSSSIRLYWLSGIAASILFCIGIFHLTTRYTPERALADTYSNPQEAAGAAQKVLILLSANLNKGMEQVIEAQNEIHKAKQIVQEQLSEK